MMRNSVNKVLLIGWVGQDVTLRTMPSGIQFAQVLVGTHDEHILKPGHDLKPTEWHKVDFIDECAVSVSKHAKKGELVLIQGKLIHRIIKSYKSTKEIRSSEILGTHFEVLREPKISPSYSEKHHPTLREEFDRLIERSDYDLD